MSALSLRTCLAAELIHHFRKIGPMADSDESRDVYRPSGGVHWFKFACGLFLTTGAALFMACCLELALIFGIYYIVIAPCVAALAVAGIWIVVLHWSHCRSPGVATWAAFPLGLLLYLGYYQVGLMLEVGGENALRVDWLPRYIHFRMKSDVARDAHDRRDVVQKQPDLIQQCSNWLFFGVETIAVVGVVVGAGRKWSSRPYCEACGKWMKSESLKLSLGSGSALLKALQQEDHLQVPTCLANTIAENAIGCSVAIDYCPSCPGEGRTTAVYLTVSDIPVSAGEPADQITPKKKKTAPTLPKLADHIALRPREVVALAAAFPKVKSGIADSKLLHEVQTAATEIADAREAQAGEWQGTYAQIEAVEAQDAGRILRRRNSWLLSLLGLAPACGGIFLGLGSLAILLFQPPDWVYGAVAACAISCLVLNSVWLLLFHEYYAVRPILDTTRRVLAGRADSAVRLDRPDLYFVEIVPRRNWGKGSARRVTDIGFLELNPTQRELIFQGDRERYWIPAESIISVQHECFAEAVQHEFQRSPTLHHFVVVRAMTTAGPWETCLHCRQPRFQRSSAKRRLAHALQLEGQIRELLPPPDRERKNA